MLVLLSVGHCSYTCIAIDGVAGTYANITDLVIFRHIEAVNENLVM